MLSEDQHIIQKIEESDTIAILNEKSIRSILDLGDESFAKNLILQYLNKAKEISAAISEDVKRKKTSEIYTLANELRDSSLYIGTERVAVISTFIYEHAKKRNIKPLKKASGYLSEALEESEKALKKLVYTDSKSDVK